VVPLTVRPVNDGLSVSVIVAPIPEAVAVRFSLTKLILETLFADPTTEPSSLIVIPVIAPAGAAVSQEGAEEPLEINTCPNVPFATNPVKSTPV
jgi:hypothetical protein